MPINPQFYSRRITILFLLTMSFISQPSWAQGNPVPVTTVSAASYENAALAPGSVASAFGTKLATTTAAATDLDTSTPVIDLPTNLAGTTVQVDGQFANLLFVSPLQVNFLIPAGTRLETVPIKITAGDGTESTGTLKVIQINPAIFTLNTNGQGVLAGAIVRVQTNGTQIREPLFQFNASANQYVTKPIDLGPMGERVFVEIYLTGVRYARDDNQDGNANELMIVELGGNHIKPDFVGRHAVFAGLDQLNFEIPRSLLGAGRLSMLVAGYNPGAVPSNIVEIEMAGAKVAPPPQPLVLETTSTTVGQKISIKGTGFSADRIPNRISINGVLAEPAEVWPDKIIVWVPYGAASGPVKVKTPQWEGQTTGELTIKPSISGWVETVGGSPLRDITIRLRGTNISAKTSREGVFLLPDVPVGEAILEVDPSTLASPVSFPQLLLKTTVQAGQDKQLPYAVALQAETGDSVFIPAEGLAADTKLTVNSTTFNSRFGSTISVTIPKGTTVRMADGSPSGKITLTNCGLKVPGFMPPGTGSSTEVVQLTPLGARFSKGLDLDYENAGNGHSLFTLDQQLNRSTLGSFIEVPNVQTVNTQGATGGRSSSYTTTSPIQETGYYFLTEKAGLLQIGQVVDFDGLPVKNALVINQRGSLRTDELGYFMNRGGSLVTGASYLRPNGRVDQVKLAVSISDPYVPISSLVLPSYETNRPPLILSALKASMFVNETKELYVLTTDPDLSPDQISQVNVSGAAFASLIPAANGQYLLRLKPTASDFGNFTLTLTAADSRGGSTTQTIALLVVTPSIAPTVTAPDNITLKTGETANFKVSASDADVGQTVKLTLADVPIGATFTPNDVVNASGGTFTWTPK